MGFRTTTMKATACLGEKWWDWNLWEIVGKQQKNEGTIQNCYRCYDLHIQNNRCQKNCSSARLLGSKHSQLRQKKPYKATSCKCHHFQIAIITCKFLNEIHLKPDETYEEIGLEAGVEIERKTSNLQLFDLPFHRNQVFFGEDILFGIAEQVSQKERFGAKRMRDYPWKKYGPTALAICRTKTDGSQWFNAPRCHALTPKKVTHDMTYINPSVAQFCNSSPRSASWHPSKSSQTKGLPLALPVPRRCRVES